MPETSPNLGLQAPLGTEPVSQGDPVTWDTATDPWNTLLLTGAA